MRIISKKALRKFWESHADAKRALQAWLDDVNRADWRTPRDLQQIYGADVVLPDNRAVFNVKGNRYRLIVKIHYNRRVVYIQFIGTHAEYDRIDARTI